MRKIAYSRDAIKTLMRMPVTTAKLIRSKIEQYAAAPESLSNNVKVPKGREGHFRLRIGDWRVIFSEDDTVAAVIRIATRGSAYD